MEALKPPVGLPTGTRPSRERRRRFINLVWIAAVADFRRRYAGTILGYAWIILQPLLLFATLYAIFTSVIRFGNDIPGYAAMLLLNIVFFSFFREASFAAMRSFQARRNIIRSVQVQALAVPLSTILSAFFVFAISLIIALIWALAVDVQISLAWLLIPVLIAYAVVVVTAVGVLLACTYVRVKDVGQVVRPVFRVMFYASGVIFPFERIPAGFFRDLAAVNPLSPLFVQVRAWLVDPSAASWPEAAGSDFATVAPFLTLAFLGALSVLVYRRTTGRIAESL